MPSNNLRVTLKGKNRVTLNQSNYVTTGGEASIYRWQDLIVKVFTDPDKMIWDRMSDKIEILSRIKHDFVVAPIDLALNDKQEPVGYYMLFADDTEPFSRVFTTAFRQRSGFTDGDAAILVDNMRDVVIIAHNHDCIQVDANELNLLMHKPAEPRYVDVDSWQIGTKWPATVIMPSIYDHHTNGFNEASDWFSWAIVSFQVFTGIHPYKGRLAGYDQSALERRMRDNASVFSPGIHLNAAVRPFSCIPQGLLGWYEATFQHGERTMPPSPSANNRAAPAARTLHLAISTSGTLIFEKLFEGGSDPVVRVYPCGIVLRQSGKLFFLATKQSAQNVDPVTPDTAIVRTAAGYLLGNAHGFHYLTSGKMTAIPFGSRHYGVLRSGNRMFAITDRGLAELSLLEMGDKALLTAKQPWNVMFNATQWFNGVGIQNALGAKFLVLPFDTDKLNFVRVHELDEVTVVAAQAGYRFVAVIALNDKGEYIKYEFSFERDHQKYTLWTGQTDTPELNLAILGNGVCATIVQDGELVVMVPTSGSLRKV